MERLSKQITHTKAHPAATNNNKAHTHRLPPTLADSVRARPRLVHCSAHSLDSESPAAHARHANFAKLCGVQVKPHDARGALDTRATTCTHGAEKINMFPRATPRALCDDELVWQIWRDGSSFFKCLLFLTEVASRPKVWINCQ